MGSLIVPIIISAFLVLWFWGPWREPYRYTGGWFDWDLPGLVRGIACAAGLGVTWLVWGFTVLVVWLEGR